MAEESNGVELPPKQKEDDKAEEVFINGDSDSMDGNKPVEFETQTSRDDTPASGTVLPRKPSIINRDGNRKGRKKTVSFSSMPKEKKIATAQDCLNYMQIGSELIKVRSNSRQYHRTFMLNPDMTEIRWYPTSKKAHKARIGIQNIKEVRVGKTTDALKNKEIAGIYQDECAFSIIYGEDFESMDLIANTADEANIWVTGLTCLLTTSSKTISSSEAIVEMQQTRDTWLLEMFEKDADDKDNCLGENEVVSLIHRLNNNISLTRIQQKLKEHEIKREDSSGLKGRISCNEFVSLFKELSTRPEIYFLLVRYATNADYLSCDDLHIFLEAEQGMQRVTKEKCLEIIQNFEPSTDGKTKGYLGIDGFTHYLLSDECDIFDPDHHLVCQDMSQPLGHYFIASSHNTYLTKDQLQGPSSVDAYVRVLQKGCRCVELDCWDGQDGDPIIKHGRTLTSSISFKAVIEAIKDHAFDVSEYPVILSIENHCSTKQQRIMVEYMTSIFGDSLCTSPIDKEETELPSPEALKRKIIIKGKKLPENSNVDEDYVTDEDESAECDKKSNNKTKDGSTNKKIKLCRELSDLVIYCVSKRFLDLQSAQQNQKWYELCSLNEILAMKLAMSCPEEFVNYNKRCLTRVYPKSLRVDSSNYNPRDLWNCGCQMIALNYQYPGLMMDLYNGWFMKNGNSGYVLKPSIMREEIGFFSANTKDVIPGVSPQILHIKVISGQHFPKPKGSGSRGDVTDPYVTIEISGIPADCAEERTKTVPHNGYCPVFDESFEFQINLPELAVVRFAVLDDEYIGDEFIAQYTIPFECMQTGYRHINLLSNTGEVIENCTLFVHIAITDRRGGGKAYKRGISVKKTKKKKDYLGMKSLGVKSIDETFKNVAGPLKDCTDLRDDVHIALGEFKETCGLSSLANVKQCIRLLATRVSNAAEQASLVVTMNGEYPALGAQGNVPDILKKALQAFEQLISECKKLFENADAVYQKLQQCQEAGLEWYEDLESICIHAGLKGKKLSKALEYFAWNIRVLKGQAALLIQAKKECQECIRQIKEAALSSGLVKDMNTNGTEETS